MKEIEKPEEDPCYAFCIPTETGDMRQIQIDSSCATCGDPFLRAGDMCPHCKKALDEKAQAFAEASVDHLCFLNRAVHVYGVGYVDPWTREGKRYLDD